MTTEETTAGPDGEAMTPEEAAEKQIGDLQREVRQLRDIAIAPRLGGTEVRVHVRVSAGSADISVSSAKEMADEEISRVLAGSIMPHLRSLFFDVYKPAADSLLDANEKLTKEVAQSAIDDRKFREALCEILEIDAREFGTSIPQAAYQAVTLAREAARLRAGIEEILRPRSHDEEFGPGSGDDYASELNNLAEGVRVGRASAEAERVEDVGTESASANLPGNIPWEQPSGLAPDASRFPGPEPFRVQPGYAGPSLTDEERARQRYAHKGPVYDVIPSQAAVDIAAKLYASTARSRDGIIADAAHAIDKVRCDAMRAERDEALAKLAETRRAVPPRFASVLTSENAPLASDTALSVKAELTATSFSESAFKPCRPPEATATVYAGPNMAERTKRENETLTALFADGAIKITEAGGEARAAQGGAPPAPTRAGGWPSARLVFQAGSAYAIAVEKLIAKVSETIQRSAVDKPAILGPTVEEGAAMRARIAELESQAAGAKSELSEIRKRWEGAIAQSDRVREQREKDFAEARSEWEAVITGMLGVMSGDIAAAVECPGGAALYARILKALETRRGKSGTPAVEELCTTCRHPRGCHVRPVDTIAPGGFGPWGACSHGTCRCGRFVAPEGQ